MNFIVNQVLNANKECNKIIKKKLNTTIKKVVHIGKR